jgi:hypothetical protein
MKNLHNDSSELELLYKGRQYSFSSWPNPDMPKIAIGVYTVWLGDDLIYVGISGEKLSSDKVQEYRLSRSKPSGLYNRLKAHRSGQRSGDKFCIYICDRYVLPSLSREQILSIASGSLYLDDLNQYFIQSNLTYRFIEVKEPTIARHIETVIKAGALPCGKPLLNPSK